MLIYGTLLREISQETADLVTFTEEVVNRFKTENWKNSNILLISENNLCQNLQGRWTSLQGTYQNNGIAVGRTMERKSNNELFFNWILLSWPLHCGHFIKWSKTWGQKKRNSVLLKITMKNDMIKVTQN